jgi:hypothetical protein
MSAKAKPISKPNEPKPNPIMLLPRTSGIIEPALFATVQKLVMELGKRDGDAYEFDQGAYRIFVSIPGAKTQIITTVTDRSFLSRCWFRKDNLKGMGQMVVHVSVHNLVCALNGQARKGFGDIWAEKNKTLAHFLTDEEKVLVVQKAKEELSPKLLASLKRAYREKLKAECSPTSVLD